MKKKILLSKIVWFLLCVSMAITLGACMDLGVTEDDIEQSTNSSISTDSESSLNDSEEDEPIDDGTPPREEILTTYLDASGGEWMNGPTVKVLEGWTPGAKIKLSMEIKTSKDGTAGIGAILVSHSDSYLKTSKWGTYPGHSLTPYAYIDTSLTGWRRVEVNTVIADDRCVYIGVIHPGGGTLASISVQIKNVEIVI